MKIEIDVDESSGGGFKPFPEGTYPVIIRDVKRTDPNDKGNWALEVLFEVTAGPMETKRFRCWYYQVPAAMWKTAKLLEASGIDFDEADHVGGKKTYRFDTDDLLGARMKMIATPKTYQGKEGNDFEELPPDSDGAAAATPAGATAPTTPDAPSGQPAATGTGFQPRSRRASA
jgi:hypothetical protein